MKAAQIVGPQRFEIVDVAKPDVSSAKDGSVLVKVDKAAICGTDVPEFAYEHPASEYPRPPGPQSTNAWALSPRADLKNSRKATKSYLYQLVRAD